MKTKYILIILLISNISFAKTIRKPSSKSAIQQECTITNNSKGTSQVIDGKLATIEQPTSPIIKMPLGCEKIRLSISEAFSLYKVQILVHPKENSQSSLCSVEERIYWKKDNVYRYQLSKSLEADVNCDEDKKYDSSLSALKFKTVNTKNYLYIDSGPESDYFSYYEVLKNSEENSKKVKYKGAIKREFFN